MKKELLGFISLLILNAGLSLMISVESGQASIGINSNLTINYEVNLDSVESFNYSISLFNEEEDYLLLSELNRISPFTKTVIYNISTIKAGEYQLKLNLSSESFPNLTVIGSENVTITELTDFFVSELGTIYALNGDVNTELVIINNGNTKIYFAAYFTNAESEIIINPQTFSINPAGNRTLEITFKKPEQDYTTTLNVIGTYGDASSMVQKEINVIIPLIELNTSEINITEGTDTTTIKFSMINYGNMDLNYSIGIRTFDLSKGFETIMKQGLIQANSTMNLNYEINKTKVTSVTIYYSNGTDNIELNNKVSLIDYIPFDFELSQTRILLIIIAILIVGFIVWSKFLRRGRP